MEANDILAVEEFVIECNDMLSGKFFDLEKRLGKFLSCMAKSEDLIDFLADCLANFDEETEFNKAFELDRKTGAAKLTLPSEDKKRLALSVTIFNNLTNGKLNSNQFLETYFQDNKLTPIQNFLDKIITPFRDILCKNFGISANVSAVELKKRLEESRKQVEKEVVQPEKEEDDLPHLTELLQEISKTGNQVLALLKFEKKRTDVLDDVEFVTNSIIRACEKGDLMVVNGLVVGLNYVSRKFKNVRHLVDDMNSLIYDYYEFLSGSTKEPSEESEVPEAEASEANE